MSPKPVAPKIFGEALSDFAHRQPAGIRRDNCSRLPNGLDFPQQRPLDLQILDDRLDHPVALADPLQVVVEIADGDQLGQRGLEERRGPGLDRCLQPLRRNSIPGRTVRIRDHPIQQKRRDAGIGQMRGNARAHGSSAQNSNLINPFHDDSLARIIE